MLKDEDLRQAVAVFLMSIDALDRLTLDYTDILSDALIRADRDLPLTYSPALLGLIHLATTSGMRDITLGVIGAVIARPGAALDTARLNNDLAALRTAYPKAPVPEDNPYVDLVLAHLYSESGQHAAALEWSTRALARVNPNEVAPAAVLRGIRAKSLGLLGRTSEGLDELQQAERDLLPWVTTFEQKQFGGSLETLIRQWW